MRHVSVDYVAGDERAGGHGGDADEGEEANDDGRVVVGRGRKEEGEGRPVCGKWGGEEEADKAGLDEDRRRVRDGYDGPQDTPVREALVRARIIWQREPQDDGDEVLQASRDPVDVAPGDEVGNDTRHDAGKEQAQEKSGCYYRDRSGAAVGWGQVGDERQHELGRHGHDCRDVGEGLEDGERLRDAEPDPDGGCSCHQAEDEWASGNQVSQWRDEKETCCISGLGEGGNPGGRFVGDAKVSGDDVEDGMHVVKVGHSDHGREAKEKVERLRVSHRFGWIIPKPGWGVEGLCKDTLPSRIGVCPCRDVRRDGSVSRRWVEHRAPFGAVRGAHIATFGHETGFDDSKDEARALNRLGLVQGLLMPP